MNSEWRDRAIDLSAPKWRALLSLPLFALYFGGVVGGSIIQSMILPGANMGWIQQVGGIVAVGIAAIFLPSRRIVFAWFKPDGAWLVRSVLVGLSITLAGEVTGLLMKDGSTNHGLEYFAYQATMPGLSEELGFRGLVLGLLTVPLLNRNSSLLAVSMVLVVAAVPFAALHILEQSGFALLIMVCFTLYAGIVLGWLRLTTGSLFAAIVAHNIANVGSGLLDNIVIWAAR